MKAALTYTYTKGNENTEFYSGPIEEAISYDGVVIGRVYFSEKRGCYCLVMSIPGQKQVRKYFDFAGDYEEYAATLAAGYIAQQAPAVVSVSSSSTTAFTNAATIEKRRRRSLGRKEATHRANTRYTTAAWRFHSLLSFFMRVETWPNLGTTTIRAYYLKYDRSEYKRHNNGLRWLQLEHRRQD